MYLVAKTKLLSNRKKDFNMKIFTRIFKMSNFASLVSKELGKSSLIARYQRLLTDLFICRL